MGNKHHSFTFVLKYFNEILHVLYSPFKLPANAWHTVGFNMWLMIHSLFLAQRDRIGKAQVKNYTKQN